MNIPTITIFLMMLLVYVVAEVSSFVFKIYINSYYSVFHFVGGGLTYLLLLSITKNSILSLVGVLVVGILWEIHEWILWKYFLKKRIYKPEKKDTMFDIIFDVLGGIVVYILILSF
jgi:hypothetical protein